MTMHRVAANKKRLAFRLEVGFGPSMLACCLFALTFRLLRMWCSLVETMLVCSSMCACCALKVAAARCSAPSQCRCRSVELSSGSVSRRVSAVLLRSGRASCRRVCSATPRASRRCSPTCSATGVRFACPVPHHFCSSWAVRCAFARGLACLPALACCRLFVPYCRLTLSHLGRSHSSGVLGLQLQIHEARARRAGGSRCYTRGVL